MKYIQLKECCCNYVSYLHNKFRAINGVSRMLVMFFMLSSFIVLAASGCSGNDHSEYHGGQHDSTVLVSLSLTPGSGVLAPGETLQFSVRTCYDDGYSKDVTNQARWDVSSADLANVDKGLVSALAPGTVTVTASFGGLSAQAEITITGATPVGLTISPESGVLASQETLQLSARAAYNYGTSQDVTEQAQWKVSDTTIADVDKGLVSALASGTVTVTASFGELSAQAEITITDADLVSITLDKTELNLLAYQSDTLSASANYSDGTSVNIDAVAEWTSSSDDIATVSRESTEAGTTVTVQGLAPGTAVITAAYKGQTAQCQATISDNPIVALEVSPESRTVVLVGETIKLKAMATFSDQTKADVSNTAEWTSNDPDKATVDKGTVTGVEEGDDAITITAKAGGLEASVDVKVGYSYIILNGVSEDVPDLEKYLGYKVEQDDQGNYHIYRNDSEITELEIPATFEYENVPYCVSGLDQEALHHCVNLQSVTLPETASYVGVSCFNGCTQLKSVKMSDIVNYIGEYAFSGCSSLNNLTLPSDITYILENTFENCSSLTSISVPSMVTSIGKYAFVGCEDLETVELPASLESLDEGTFESCSSLKTVELPQNLKSLGEGAFKLCSSLETVNIPAKVTAIPKELFANCDNLQTVTLYMGTEEAPAVLTSIGPGAFLECKNLFKNLESVAIPATVTSIGDQAFKGCSSITELIVPDGVDPIGDEAFADVSHITYHGKASGQLWGANGMN
ncbi:MAG: leucine-rich repeat protein [bacterium]|nr:leucine-rich repeat protein [bacterium]